MKKSNWGVTALTLFPGMFPGPLGQSIAGKALEDGLWNMDAINIRDFATDKHQTVDDSPFGGGVGMVMRPDVVSAAVDAAHQAHPARKLVYLTPRGKVLTQQKVREFTESDGLILLCGRYEGVDQRILDHYTPEEVSLGDFVLSGGEIAALALIDACVRLLPGVLSKADSVAHESFGTGPYAGLLEYPHYTRPAEWRGLGVPGVLLSGHHKEIDSWRVAQAEEITKHRRKDLWDAYLAAKKLQGKK